MPLVRFEILAVGTVGQRTVVAVQSLAGEPRAGLHLLTADTHELWEVRGIAFAPIEAVEAGRCGLLLVPLGHDSALRVGELLLAA